MIAVSFNARNSFFDRHAVRSAMDKATARAMSKAGAFVRRRARSSIRRTKKKSQPGNPPRAHSRDSTASIKNILFFYDKAKRTTVVGPVKLNMVTFASGMRPQAGTVPSVLEFGGTVVIREWQLRDGRWVRADNRMTRTLSQKLKEGRVRLRRATIAARPFMRPALEKESPNFPKLFYDQLDKAS